MTTPAGAPTTVRPTFEALRNQIARCVKGQEHIISGVLIALLADGHVLLEGVPGTAKTLLVRTLAEATQADAKRVQFTPDLMPGDITGSMVFDAQAAEFSFSPGPVFANFVIADEINRTPAKTQAALLEAMEERCVTVDGVRHPLPDVFCVAATQNPVEQEGTYPLPEAQLDRFLVKLQVDMPDRDAELAVVSNHVAGFNPNDLSTAGIEKILTPADILQARAEVANLVVEPHVVAYAVDICRETRNYPSVSLGVSPRGSVALIKAARAWAWLTGKGYVDPDDIKALAPATLNHRIALETVTDTTSVTSHQVISSVLETLPVPK